MVWTCTECKKEFKTKKGADDHVNYYCKGKDSYEYNQNYGYKKNGCYRCGRTGHFADNCYASTHQKGYYLGD